MTAESTAITRLDQRQNTSLGRYEPDDLRGLCEFAKIVVDSNLAPKHVKKWQDAMLIMKRGAELGLSTQMSLENIFVINGKTTMYADCAVALIKSRGHRFEVVESTDDRAIIKTVRVGYDDSGETYSSGKPFTYTYAMAKKAGWTSNKMYQSIPRNMLLARAKMELARMVYEDLLAGLYDPTEMIHLGSAEVVQQVRAHYGDATVEATLEERSEPSAAQQKADAVDVDVDELITEGDAKKQLLAAVKSVLGLKGDEAAAKASAVWAAAGFGKQGVARADLDQMIDSLTEPKTAPEEDDDDWRGRRNRKVFALLGEVDVSKDEVELARHTFLAAEYGADSQNDLERDELDAFLSLLDEKSVELRTAWVQEWASIGALAQRDEEE